ncbi:MAG TPA: hypothetical protein VMV77_09265 [Bacteroidales bacterium]|nr:hypothetical protein [Bacteroidales bacterium]
MSRKTRKPGKNENLIPYEIDNFGAGLIKGLPASKIPGNAVAHATDVIIHKNEIVGREGCVRFAGNYNVVIPPIDNRTGYTASKSGKIITAPASTFTEADASNYFVFPGSPDTHYEITEYISDTQVRVHSEGDHTSTLNCYLRGKTNLMEWHKIARRWIFMWGQDIYIAKWNMDELVRCRIISRDLPNNATSGYDDFDNLSSIIFNSNGMFRIDLEREIPLVYKLNVPIPNRAIPDITKTTTSEYNYHYLYSACRLFEDGVKETVELLDNLIPQNSSSVNRLLPSRIEQETGTNIWDASFKDYADVYTDDPIGRVLHLFGAIELETLVPPYDTIAGWLAISGNGSFETYSSFAYAGVHVVNFANVMDMSEVALRIQDSLRFVIPEATCKYIVDHFIITTGRIPGSFINAILPGTVPGTTSIRSAMGGFFTEILYKYTYTPKVVGPLYVPNVPNVTPQEYQWHFTHFPVYRTRDLSGRYKLGIDADQFNSPNDFVWVNDVRVCAAFYGHFEAGIGYVYFVAEKGYFNLEDIGSTIELDNGDRVEILNLSAHNYAIVDYYNYYGYNPNVKYAAAIGNGRVMRATQTGNVITRTHGDIFTPGDVRKPITWATGYHSYITEYIDANRVRVVDSQDKTVMGITIDPVYRYFNDTIDDTILETRLTRLKLKQRYWQAMPNGNIGKVTPGLIFSAMRGDGQLNYGQIPDTLEYLHGFHDKGYQLTNVIPDDIQFMWFFQDLIIIWTSRKTWRWPTAGYQFIANPYTKDVILQISGLEIAEEDRGCFNWGSIEPVGDGKVIMLTSEPGQVGLRRYNGYQYGPNELEVGDSGRQRIPDIQKLQQATRTIYDGHIGLLLFGRE